MRVIRGAPVLALIATAACADPGDPPEGEPLINVTEGDFVQVATSNFVMDFSGTGVKMPSSMRILDAAGNGFNKEILATNGCNLEGAIGLALFPAVSVIAGDQGDQQRSNIEVLMAGPVLAKVRVTYEVDYRCP